MKSIRQGEIEWRRVVTPADALRFIDAAGFCLLFPVKDIPLPSLYFAMTRRIPITWDKYALKLWDWKSDFPRKRRAFYGKHFRGRGTFLSLGMLPDFLAMHGSAAAPSEHARFYAEGRISHDAATIWETLERLGPLATLELRHACKMDSKAGNVRFKRAMAKLQGLLLVTHFGAEQETEAWASGRFELTSRAFSLEVEAARVTEPAAARAAVAARYLHWHLDAEPKTITRLFGWSREETLEAVSRARRSQPNLRGREAQPKAVAR